MTDTEDKTVISIEELRKRSLMIATPMYGGMCTGFFTQSLNELTSKLNTMGIKNTKSFIYNESLIPRARNYLADEFMRSDYTHFLFIDADVVFNPDDAISLLAIAEPGSDKSIVAGVYPKKNISWEKVAKAVDKGLADENPEILAQVAGDFVFNVTEPGEHSINKPMPVTETGTGFMMIQRKVFEDFAEKYPELKYYPDHKRSEHFDGEREITGFFMDPLVEVQAPGQPVRRRHLSEDYFFCRWSAKIGHKTWICPWMRLHHVGTYIYIGDFPLVVSAGLHATLDPEDYMKMKKNKEKK